jgi:hypothetical protein
LVASRVEIYSHIEIFRELGLEYQFVEAILLAYGTLVFKTLPAFNSASEGEAPPIPTEWVNSNWEVHQDVGYKNILSGTSRRDISYSSLCPPCTRPVEEFSTQYLEKDASALRANAVYRSTVNNMPIGEFLTVHDEKGIRYVTFHQCTTKDLNDHEFTVSSLRKWLLNLGISAEEKVRVRIVCYVDWTQKTRHGMKFVDEQAPYDIHELKKKFPGEFDIIETFIVRLGIYPTLKTSKAQLPGRSGTDVARNYGIWSIANLKSFCRSLGLSAGGKREDLIDRLLCFDKYDVLTISELKKLCVSRGLSAGEKKPDLIHQLLFFDEYEVLTILKLKESCLSRDLSDGGKKEELIHRLLSFDKYDVLTVQDLKKTCESRGLGTKGKKIELIHRLLTDEV